MSNGLDPACLVGAADTVRGIIGEKVLAFSLLEDKTLELVTQFLEQLEVSVPTVKADLQRFLEERCG